MDMEVIEKIDSRESTTVDSATVDLKYLITGTADDIQAKSQLGAHAPALYDGLTASKQ